jgi:hypothetical protein
MPKTKTTSAKDQGFPAVYLSPTGTFKIGHDASAKRDLFSAVLKLDNPKGLHTFTEAEAMKLIKARGWTPLLEAKRKLVAEKAKATKAEAKPAPAKPATRKRTTKVAAA